MSTDLSKKFFKSYFIKILPVILLSAVYSCTGTGDDGFPNVQATTSLAGTTTTTGTTTSTASAITLSANPIILTVGETSTVTANVFDSADSKVTDGTTVTFTVDNSDLGSITASGTTSSGTVSVTFTSTTTPGSPVITATSGTGSDTVTITVAADTSPASVTLAASPTSLTVGGTATITATVRDSSSTNVPDGTAVSFSLDNSSLGTVTANATTSSGIATATFTASSDTPGTVTITASAGSAIGTTSIAISAADTGSIEFLSVTPADNIIGIKGSGKTETAVIKFSVKDINGNAVLDGVNVDFCLSGPSGGRLPSAGGEYLNDQEEVTEVFTDANSNGCYDTGETFTDTASGTYADTLYSSPVHASSSTVGGVATVNLHSGLVSGNVTILATVQSTGLASSSGTISIGGGIANMQHFSLALSDLNIAGLAYINEQSTLSLLIADRFGNANLLADTTVSYYTESGATISSTSVLDSAGSTSMVYRTQNPNPEDVVILGGGACAGGSSSWYSIGSDWESCLLDYVNTTYGISTTKHPRDGWATLTAAIVGEEHFDDSNGNGMYDSGEFDAAADDTEHEVFVDSDDDDVHDDGTNEPNGAGNGFDPEELYIDSNMDGSHDTKNTTWDSSKTLFKDIKILITGAPVYIKIYSITNVTANPGSYTIANGGSESFRVIVADENLNQISGTSTVEFSLAGDGTLIATDHILTSGFSYGPYESSFSVSDSAPGTVETKASAVTITVTWKGQQFENVYTLTLNGTVE